MDAERDAADRRAAFEAALGGEYFALNGLRSSTTSESSTRATIYFTTMSGTLLALGFLAGSTDAVVPVAYAAVPTVAVLGLLAFLRLVELAAVDVSALQAIQRMRSYWRALVPDGADYFPPATPLQAVDALLDTGERRGLFRATLTIAASVGLVNSLWIAAGAAFASADLGLPPAAAVVVGLMIGAVTAVALFRHQARRIGHVVGDVSGDSPGPTS